MSVELVTVPRVPIVRTGHYDLQSGPVDFTADHLAAAVQAFENDPAVLAPRIRVESAEQGHLDGDGIAVEAAGGSGGPALGWCDALVFEGDTLYADMHVPAELAGCLEWAFPARSVEGLFGYTTATGHRHDFMATGLLLLGTSWPGVTTLPDMRELEQEFAETIAEEDLTVTAGFAAPIHATALPDGAAVVARIGVEPVTAGLAVTDLRRRWYGAEADGELEGLPDSYDFWSWYVTEERVDDDGTLYVVCVDEANGDLWRFDVASIDGTAVTFAAPTRGALDWRPVTAAASSSDAPVRPAMALGRWTSRGDSRAAAAGQTNEQEDDRPMTDEQRRNLAVSHGLNPDTATEADIFEAAATRAADPEAGGDPVVPAGEQETTDVDADAPVPAGVAARTATVSRERLEALERDAAVGVAAQARQVHGDRDRLVLAALEAGRITPAESGLGERDPQTGLYAIAESGWRRDLEDAPVVSARALERLAPGRVPGTAAAKGVVPQEGARAGSLERVLASVPGLNHRNGGKQS